jgi:hypothetical protein
MSMVHPGCEVQQCACGCGENVRPSDGESVYGMDDGLWRRKCLARAIAEGRIECSHDPVACPFATEWDDDPTPICTVHHSECDDRRLKEE